MFNLPIDYFTKVCNCDKSPTLPAMIFEIFIFAATALMFYYLSKISKNILKKYFIIAIGVFIFEFFTAPMWINNHLGQWAYVYKDVSWVLTMGWTTLILSTVLIVDKFFPKTNEWLKFIYYLILLTIEVLIFESIVLKTGIRGYTPETLELIGKLYIPILDVPAKALYYVPSFSSLVIAFYKYWNYLLEDEPLVPRKSTAWFRNLIISVVAVISFELMIDPMVINAKLPSWSYFYRDISFIMTGIWIVLIWLATNIIDRIFIHFNLTKKFVLYVLSVSIIMIPLEAWFINNGYRIYGPTSISNFTGFKISLLNLPIEVAFAIPMYLALIIAFVRYFEIVFDNKK